MPVDNQGRATTGEHACGKSKQGNYEGTHMWVVNAGQSRHSTHKVPDRRKDYFEITIIPLHYQTSFLINNKVFR